MCMKNGMSAGRLDDCHYKREKMVKRNNIGRRRKEKLRQHNSYGWTLVE